MVLLWALHGDSSITCMVLVWTGDITTRLRSLRVLGSIPSKSLRLWSLEWLLRAKSRPGLMPSSLNTLVNSQMPPFLDLDFFFFGVSLLTGLILSQSSGEILTRWMRSCSLKWLLFLSRKFLRGIGACSSGNTARPEFDRSWERSCSLSRSSGGNARWKALLKKRSNLLVKFSIRTTEN